MNQESLFGDDIYQSLKDLVEALGDKKSVAYELRPDLGPIKAAQWLGDALNPKRREVLAPHYLIQILNMAQQRGIHTTMWLLCNLTGYEQAKPENPAQQIAELEKEFLSAVASLKELASVIEHKRECVTDRMGPRSSAPVSIQSRATA